MRPGPIDIAACPRCGALAKIRTISSGNTMGARAWSDGKTDAPMMPTTPPIACCGACKAVHRTQDAKVIGSFPFYQELDAVFWQLDIVAIPKWSKALLRTLRKRFGDATEADFQAMLPLTVETGLKHLEAGKRAEQFEKLGATIADKKSARPNYTGPLPLSWVEAPDVTAPNERELLAVLGRGVDGEAREWVLELRISAWQAANDPRRDRDPSLPVIWSLEARSNLEALVTLLHAHDPEQRILKAEALRELGRFEEALALLGERPGLLTRLRELAARGHAGVVELSAL